MNRLALTLLAAAAFAGCASAPPTRWHSLQSGVPPERLAEAAAPGTLLLQIDPPQVPRQLDQAQWLVRRADDSLVTLEHERWSAALPDELRAALLELLAQRYGVTDSRVVAGAAPAWRLTLQILRLETLPGREVQWDSVWSLAAAGAAPLTCRSTLRVAAAAGYPALAAAHRAALARLAEQIGTPLLQARPQCPSDAAPS